MGRKQEMERHLSVKVPSFFRCPISLDVMKSPVSLCTGVTYDRSSIQRWLESGNNTCPATMQPLPSTDLVPNLTLQRLINIWAQAGPPANPNHAPPHSLLADIRSSPHPAPSLLKLAAFFDDSDADDLDKNRLVAPASEALAPFIADDLSPLDLLEASIAVLDRILESDCVDKENKHGLIRTAIGRNLDGSVSSLIRTLKDGRSLESRIHSARVISAALTNISESKIKISEKKDLIPELIRLASENGSEKAQAVDAALSCLVALSAVRRARIRMVRSGAVPVLARILAEDAAAVPAAAAEKAMMLMEAASGCADGREAICEAAGTAIPAILRRMMKTGRGGTEAAVAVLWSVCHLFRDRRAQEAVEAGGGLTKMLLLMQSDCSPAVRQMAGDLLRLFKVNAKCCLAGYDTKTTHIMPF